MRDEKQKLRVRVLLQRESLPASKLGLWNQLIQERVAQFSPYLSSRSVALYSPIGNEVATEGIRDRALEMGKKVFYPRMRRDKHLDLIRIGSAGELKPGRYGILEPTGDEVMTRQEQDGLVIFVPGLAFDLEGNRLGRGKGFYDRVLERLGGEIRFVGLAYELQVVQRLPADTWDQKVHQIITERRTIECGNLRSQSGWVS